jgi:acetoin utilization deacetylase AcuC-like enzyme
VESVAELGWSLAREYGDYDLESIFYRVHSAELIDYFRETDTALQDGRLTEPFMPREAGGDAPPQGGYPAREYCFDSDTPLMAGTWQAACAAFASGMRAAALVNEGRHRLTYALCRPPGAAAGRSFFGRHCYLNNAAAAAATLAEQAPTAVISLGYHPAIGTQDVFYRTNRVFTASIHARNAILPAAPDLSDARRDDEPVHTYSGANAPGGELELPRGHPDERGTGPGKRRNRNDAMPDGVTARTFLRHLRKSIRRAKRSGAESLVVSLSTDIVEGDPYGSLGLPETVLPQIAHEFRRTTLPTVIVQEGGYDTERLGLRVKAFLEALQ